MSMKKVDVLLYGKDTYCDGVEAGSVAGDGYHWVLRITLMKKWKGKWVGYRKLLIA